MAAAQPPPERPAGVRPARAWHEPALMPERLGPVQGIVTLTAVLQAADRLATFFCKQTRASLPPGVTPEHFDMKSERQEARMALCCSAVTCARAIAERNECDRGQARCQELKQAAGGHCHDVSPLSLPGPRCAVG